MAASSNSGIYRKFLLGGGGLLLVLVAILLVFRVTTAEIIGKATLSGLGFEDVVLNIDAITTDRLQIAQLSLSDQIKLRQVTLNFTPFSLVRGHVDVVDIGSVFIDLSHPEQGALARIKTLAEEQRRDVGSTEKFEYPVVILQDGEAVFEREGRAIRASMRGALNSDQVLTVESSLQGHIETAAGQILFEDVSLSVKADIEAQLVTARLEKGTIRDGAEEENWAPMLLTGEAQLKEGLGSIRVTTTTSEGQSSLVFEGYYDTERETGNASLDIQDLAFRRDGLQPSDLSRHAEIIPPLDGKLTLTARMKAAAQEITYSSDVAMENLAMEITDGRVQSDHARLHLSGQFSLEDYSQTTSITLPNMAVNLNYSGGSYVVEDLAAELNVVNLADNLELVALGATIRDTGSGPDFSPIHFSLTGAMENLNHATVKGVVGNNRAGLNIGVTAQYDFDIGSGTALVKLPKTEIGKGQVSLGALSPHLRFLDKTFDGTVAAEVKANRNAEGEIWFSALRAEIEGGRWQETDLTANGISFDVSGEQQNATAPITGSIKGRVDRIDFQGQKMSVPSLNAEFAGLLDHLILPTEANLSILELIIKPENGATFKEIQKVSGAASLKDDEVEFSINLATDFLGSYLNMKGLHSVASGVGKATIDVDPLLFEKNGLQPADLVVLATDLSVEGQVTPQAKLAWSGNKLKGTADVAFQDVTLRAPGSEIGGIFGKVHIDELFPLTISIPQEINAQSAVAGIPLGEPHIRFRVLTTDEFPVLFIDRLAVKIAGGTAFIDDAVIDTGAEVNSVELQVTRLDLEEVLALSSVEELIATGRVSGRIPLVFGGDRLIIEEGHLSADGPGILKMTSDAARQALGGGGDQTQLLLDILENFQYSELSIKIKKTETGDDTVKLHAAGSNPDVENNRRVILNINLETSLDKIFNAILEGYLLSEKALRATVDGR